ncbi:MAG: DUF3365 domain-containing protein [Planctomycetaceae bacterium]|nr:DUF3365 domain-containing protein [Planctomycetaceae bacterium]
MTSSRLALRSIVLLFAGSLAVATAAGLFAGPPAPVDDVIAATIDDSFPGEATRVSVVEARRQAEVLHAAVHSTLQLVHHTYFREDEGLPLPAGVMREMFSELEAEEHVRLRWLAVEGQAMNTDHLPQTDFEQRAFESLKAGEKSYEAVADGVYRRAGRITLANQCLKCHVPDRKTTENRTAGLIIAIPVTSGE